MRILIISPTFPPMRSGGADFAFRLSQHLSARGHEIQVITSAIKDVINDPQLAVQPVMSAWSWAELPRLLHIVQRSRPDVVDIHFTCGVYNNQPMITMVPALLKRWVPGVRVVLHVEYPEPVHVNQLGLLTRAMRKACTLYCGRKGWDYGYGSLLRDSDQIIVLGATHRAMLADGDVDIATKCRILPPPVSIKLSPEGAGSEGRAQLGIGTNTLVLAYYGYLDPGKGIEHLLEAFRTVRHEQPDSRLLIIGSANDVVLRRLNRVSYVTELRELSRRLGIDKYVLWTQYFASDSEQPSIFLRTADIGVLPFKEGVTMNRSSFGVLAAHGLPIVTTQREGLEEQFVDHENVMLCPPEDGNALASALLTLIRRPELRHRLQDGARKLAERYFSWQHCVDETLQVFQDKR